MNTQWLELVNTDWHDYRGTGKDEDRLLQPCKIAELLALWNFEIQQPVTGEMLYQLQQLRSLLLRMIASILARKPIHDNHLAELNQYLRQAPAHLVLSRSKEGYTLSRSSCQPQSWSWILGCIAASFAETLAGYDLTRIKQCSNPDCRWIYYDESHNKSRRWCEEPCANMMRVRKFRQRNRQEI